MKLLLRSVPIVALIAAGPMLSACQNSKPNADLESRVQDRLKQENIKDVSADME